MDITIKINDDLGRDANHRAVDAGLSLPSWIAEVISKELGHSKTVSSKSLLEALGNEQLSDLPIEFPRESSAMRSVDLS